MPRHTPREFPMPSLLLKKHTPGPWKLVKRSNQTGVRSLMIVGNPESGNKFLCEIPPERFGPEVGEANARLIAAAPEMAEALRRAYEVLNGSDLEQEQPVVQNTLERIEAALKKAGVL